MTRFSDPQQLVGEEISAVCFVRDYIELHFDGPILRFLGKIELECDDRRATQGTPGFRDLLSESIGAVATELTIADMSALTLRTSTGCAITVPFEGGEAVHFLPEVGAPLQVW